jgi:hypothetical protein
MDIFAMTITRLRHLLAIVDAGSNISLAALRINVT